MDTKLCKKCEQEFTPPNNRFKLCESCRPERNSTSQTSMERQLDEDKKVVEDIQDEEKKPNNYRKALSPTATKCIFTGQQGNCCRGPGENECVKGSTTLWCCPHKLDGKPGKLEDPNINNYFKGYNYEFDHIIPKEQGGDENITNMQALCVDCHSTKTKMSQLIKSHKITDEDDEAMIIVKSLSVPK